MKVLWITRHIEIISKSEVQPSSRANNKTDNSLGYSDTVNGANVESRVCVRVFCSI